MPLETKNLIQLLFWIRLVYGFMAEWIDYMKERREIPNTAQQDTSLEIETIKKEVIT